MSSITFENHYRLVQLWQMRSSNTAVRQQLFSAFTENGFPFAAVVFDSSGRYIQYDSGGSNGDLAGITPSGVPAGAAGAHDGIRTITKPFFYGKIKTGGSTSSVAYHFGVTGNIAPIPDSIQNEAKFWYDTNVHSDGFWRTVTDNASGSPEVQVTSVAFGSGIRLEAKLDMSDSSKVLFYANGSLVSTHQTVVPDSGTTMSWIVCLKNRSAASRTIKIGRLAMTCD